MPRLLHHTTSWRSANKQPPRLENLIPVSNTWHDADSTQGDKPLYLHFSEIQLHPNKSYAVISSFNHYKAPPVHIICNVKSKGWEQSEACINNHYNTNRATLLIEQVHLRENQCVYMALSQEEYGGRSTDLSPTITGQHDKYQATT